jgi:hypothetical protein
MGIYSIHTNTNTRGIYVHTYIYFVAEREDTFPLRKPVVIRNPIPLSGYFFIQTKKGRVLLVFVGVGFPEGFLVS